MINKIEIKKLVKRASVFSLSAIILASSNIAALADSIDEEVEVQEDDTPFISLGADLTTTQLATVLELLGVDEDDLDEYDVAYVTNDEEYEYLSSYISASKIGSNALSSVVVMQGEDGDGIDVTTKNISYCTEGMYKNALSTAGVEDAQVIVAGPMSISGTAALVGVFKAYENMTGDEIDEDSVDAAVNELVITGEIEDDDDSSDADTIEGMIAYVKQEVVSGDVDAQDTQELADAIEEASEEFGVELTTEQAEKISALMQKIDGLDLDADSIAQQASDVLEKVEGMVDSDTWNSIKDAISSDEAQGFFQKLISSIKNFFTGLFS